MNHFTTGALKRLQILQYLLWVSFLLLLIFTCFVLFSDTRYKQLQGLAIDSQDNYYVSDSGNAVITKYDSQRQPLLTWGGKGNADGRFAEKLGVGDIALDSANNLYVIDKGNYRIQKFDSNGNFLAKWGNQGSAPDQFAAPSKITVSDQGRVYVWDAPAVKVFDTTGRFQGLVGTDVTGSTRLNGANGLTVDAAGNLYVAGNSPQQIFKFSPQGALISNLVVSDLDASIFDGLRSLTIDGHGNLYMSGSASAYFAKIDSSGKLLLSAQVDRDNNNFALSQLALDSHNNVFAVNQTETRIDSFDNSGKVLNRWSIGWPRWLIIYLPLALVSLSFGNLAISNRKTLIKQKLGIIKQPESRRVPFFTASTIPGKIAQFVVFFASLSGILLSSVIFGVSSRLLPAGFISTVFEPGNVALDLSVVLVYATLFLTVGFIPRRPFGVGLFQVAGGFLVFLLADVSWLKIPGLLVVVAGALVLGMVSRKKEEEAASSSDPT